MTVPYRPDNPFAPGAGGTTTRRRYRPDNPFASSEAGGVDTGGDPGGVIGEVLREDAAALRDAPAATAPPAPDTPGVGEQVIGGVKVVGHAIAHPIETVKGMATGLVTDARNVFRPVIGQGEMPGSTRFGDEGAVARSRAGFVVTRENTPDALTPGEQARAAINTGANLALGPASLLGNVALGGVLGAISDPEQPARGATAGALFAGGIRGTRAAVSAVRGPRAPAPSQLPEAVAAGLRDRLARGEAVALRGVENPGDLSVVAVRRRPGHVATENAPGTPAAEAVPASVGTDPAALEALSRELGVDVTAVRRRPRAVQEALAETDALGARRYRPDNPYAPRTAPSAPPVEPGPDVQPVSFGPEDFRAGPEPVVSANGRFDARPGVLRKVNRDLARTAQKAAEPIVDAVQGANPPASQDAPDAQRRGGRGARAAAPVVIADDLVERVRTGAPLTPEELQLVQQDPELRAIRQRAVKELKAPPPIVEGGASAAGRTVSSADSPTAEGTMTGSDAWFEGSTIADKQGKPLTVYHGNPSGSFEGGTFDMARVGTGGLAGLGKGSPSAIFLTDSQAHAAQFGKPIPLHAAIRNPLVVDAVAMLEDWRASEFPEQFRTVQEMVDQYYDGEVYRAFGADEEFARLINEAHRAGHDGVVVDFGSLKDAAMRSRVGRVIVALSPEQIRTVGDKPPPAAPPPSPSVAPPLDPERLQAPPGPGDQPNEPPAPPRRQRQPDAVNPKFRLNTVDDLQARLREIESRMEDYGQRGETAGWVRFDDDESIMRAGNTAATRRLADDARLAEEVRAELRARGVDVDAPPLVDDDFTPLEEPFDPRPVVDVPEGGEGVPPRPAMASDTEAPRQRPDAEYLNVPKFGQDDSPLGRAVSARIQERVARLRAEGLVDKGYQSFAEQTRLKDDFARKLLANPLEIDRAKLTRLDGYQVVALHDVVNENTAVLEAASRAVESGTLTGDDLAAALRTIDEAQRATDEALSAIVTEKAQTARSLGYFRQLARQSTDPAVWIVTAKKLLGDKPLPDAVLVEIRRLAKEATDVCGGGA